MNEQNFVITRSELFRHPKFGNLRVITDENGDPWFVGAVVAEALGYKVPQKAITDHVLSEDRKVPK
jgi:prophage antirepressor-like protein